MYKTFFIDLYTQNGFSYEEARAEIDFICDILYDYGYKDYILGKELSPDKIKEIKEIIEERVTTRKPVQKILGVSYFYGRKFFLSEDTLVPRPETELLVENTLKKALKFNNPYCLDIGTGSGCIPITCVRENKNIKFDACDISSGALETAKKNSLILNADKNIKFILSNLFENITGKYDIIVSNPPYIPLKDANALEKEVRNYDPYQALFAPDEEGIFFYKKIIKESGKYLKSEGCVIFEIGKGQSKLVKKIFEEEGFINIEILKDFNNIDRIITGSIN